MVHAAITLGICLFVALAGLPAWVCLLPAVWFMGRELAQAEYRYIEDYCGGLRANMPWYGGFMLDAWTVKGVLDWLFPTVVAVWSMFLLL